MSNADAVSRAKQIAATADDWENGKLGDDDQYVRRAGSEVSEAVDEAMALQMISIRLQKTLIENLKFIATAHGIGYQPLIRDILSRFVVHEKKKIIQDAIERKQQELEQEAQAIKELELELERRKVA
jgi:predicted DNA binding CopG/RHH family protein